MTPCLHHNLKTSFTQKKTLRSQLNHYRQWLYESPPKASTSSASAVSERATASAESPEASSVLNMVRYAINKTSSRLESLRNFCLPLSIKYVSYSLSKGKNEMSKLERLYATALLPSSFFPEKSGLRNLWWNSSTSLFQFCY
jgi:hypothetical protein